MKKIIKYIGQLCPKKMAEPAVDSEIVIPIVPTFFHLSLVKVAIPLFYKYGSDELNMAMTYIQIQNLPATPNVGFREEMTMNHNEAKEALLLVPQHLRRNVLEAINGIESEISRWLMHHRFVKLESENFRCRVEDIFFWRSDGTINRLKTAQELVLNENFSKDCRFRVACEYCFKDKVKVLWDEMVKSGEAENFKAPEDSLENGWIEWIRGGALADWTQIVLRPYHGFTRPRYGSIFSALPTADRKKALNSLLECGFLDLDDLRICLYAMTNEEKEKVLKMDIIEFIFIFACWPFQNYFLEVAERVKNYIYFESYLTILRFIACIPFTEDFEYGKLIAGFLKINPHHHRKFLKEYRPWSDHINECIATDRSNKIRYEGPRKRLRRFYH